MLSNNPRRLLIQYVNDALGAAIHDGVQQNGRNGNKQTQYRRYQSGGDTARHCLGITGTENCDRLEGDNHTGNGTQKSEKWR